MSIIQFYQTGEEVLVKTESHIDMPFFDAEIIKIDEVMTMLFRDGLTMDFSVKQVDDLVFKRTPIVLNSLERYNQGDISKDDLLTIALSNALSRKYCSQCRYNFGRKETRMVNGTAITSIEGIDVSMDDVEFLGTIWLGDDDFEEGSVESVYKHKGKYFMTYMAGNQHEHLSSMSEGEFEKIKDKVTKSSHDFTYDDYLASISTFTTTQQGEK